MQNDKQALFQAVEQYRKAIHTQSPEDFFPLWAEECETSLISLANCYRETKAIYQEFLLGGIRKAYSRIDLLVRDIEVRPLNENCAVVLFSYCTDCIRRESGEHHSIAGLETQVYIRENGNWKLAHVQYAKED